MRKIVNILKEQQTDEERKMKDKTPSQLINAKIKELADWRGEMLSHIRTLIMQADSKIVEEWKWGVTAWYHNGLICTGETYKSVVNMTFRQRCLTKRPLTSLLFESRRENKMCH
jgi:hypothetical protein